MPICSHFQPRLLAPTTWMLCRTFLECLKQSFNFRTKLHNHTITMFRTRPHSQSHRKPGAHRNECKKPSAGFICCQLRSVVPTLVLQGCSQPTFPLEAALLFRFMLLSVIPHRPESILCRAIAAQAHGIVYLYVNPRQCTVDHMPFVCCSIKPGSPQSITE